MTPKEINEAVALNLGYQLSWAFNGYWARKSGTGWEGYKKLPDYQGSISSAWEIVEYEVKRGKGFTVCYLDDGWNAEIFEKASKTHPMIIEKADTAPMAICLAFLALSSARKES